MLLYPRQMQSPLVVNLELTGGAAGSKEGLQREVFDVLKNLAHSGGHQAFLHKGKAEGGAGFGEESPLPIAA